MATTDGRAKALSFLKNKMPDAFVGKEGIPELGGVSTGCIAIDYIVGNEGFPRGKVSEIFGLEGSGKSTVCMSACAKAQATGLYPVYIDVERGIVREHADRLGFDVADEKKGLYVIPDTFEEMLVMVEQLAVEAEADIIFVDSVPALVPDAIMKGEITEMGQFGQAARLFAGSLPRLVKIIEKTDTALVFVNQLRANIVTDQWKAKWAPKEKSFGGYALRYYSSMRLELVQKDKKAVTRKRVSLTDAGKEEDIPVASLHQATTFKSKVSQPYQTIEFFIRYDPVQQLWGIDNLQTILDVARAKGFIETKGSTYVYNTKSHRGEEKLYDWFATHADDLKALRAQIGL